MIEFTCSICENKYPSIGGVPEECICNNCWEYDDITDDEDEKEFIKNGQRLYFGYIFNHPPAWELWSKFIYYV